MQVGGGATALPLDRFAFGARLAALRGRRGLRALAADQLEDPHFHLTISKSQLDRYEKGELLPPLQHARHLDLLYGGEGWVEVALRSLWRSDWNPWTADEAMPSRIHAVAWPAQLSGVVWLKIKPIAGADTEPEHVIEIEWGPWCRSLEVSLPTSGVLLITGKAADDDGVAKTLNLTSTHRLFLLHGAGDDFDTESVIDIRRGWRLAPGERAIQPPLE